MEPIEAMQHEAILDLLNNVHIYPDGRYYYVRLFEFSRGEDIFGMKRTYVINGRLSKYGNWSLYWRLDYAAKWDELSEDAKQLRANYITISKIRDKAIVRDRAHYMELLAKEVMEMIDWIVPSVAHCRGCDAFIPKKKGQPARADELCSKCLNKCYLHYKIGGLKVECPICLDHKAVDIPIRLSCEHLYHRGCISRVQASSGGTFQCPLCREPYSRLSLIAGDYELD
jgi:hypothetical protein